MKDGKEVFALKGSILREVCAVDCILRLINTESSSESMRSKVLGDFRVGGTSQISESLDGVFLSDLKSDAGSSCHMIDNGNKLRDYTFVDLEKLFSSGLVQSKHFHC